MSCLLTVICLKKNSQVAQQQVSIRAPARMFPRQPQPNLEGNVNPITLQSGKELEVIANKRGEGKYTESESVPSGNEGDPNHMRRR